MPPLVAFTGLHNSGKTTVARKVVSRLIIKGYKAAVVKSTKHENLEKEINRPGSDTALYREEGVEAVAIIDSSSMILFKDHHGESIKKLSERFFYDFDIIILEGFKSVEEITKLEVVNQKNSEAPLYRSVKGIDAVISDEKPTDIPSDVTFFLNTEINELSNFIEQRYILPFKENYLTLYVNGKVIETNNFVKSALTGTVMGFVKSLRGTSNAEFIDIKIKPVNIYE